jgi:uncharacterized protein YhhL (DUF1145 family)
MGDMKSSSLAKPVVMLDSAFVILACAVALSTPPANGYEISIYDAFPTYFWFLVLVPIVTPFLGYLMMNRSLSKGLLVVLYWNAASSLLLFLSLPLIRGYAFYNGGDSLSHLGIVKDVILNGHITSANFYPIIHVWISTLSDCSGAGPQTIMLYVPQLFSLFYALSVFLLARTLKPKTSFSRIALALALVPVFGAYHICVFPSSEAFFMIPFAMYLLIRSKTTGGTSALSFSIAVVIMLVVFPFFHPEATLFLLIMMVVMHYSSRLSKLASFQVRGLQESLQSISVPILVLVASFGFWFLTSLAFAGTIEAVYQSFALNLGQAPLDLYAISLSKAHVGIVEMLDLLVRTRGVGLILIGLAALSTATTVIRTFRKMSEDFSETVLAALFIVLSLLAAFFLFRDLLIGERPMKYLLFISALLAGSYLLRYSQRTLGGNLGSLRKRLSFASIIVAIVFASTFAVMTAYPSPVVVQPNWQATQAEFSGMDFFFTCRDRDLLAMEIATSQARFKDALFGKEYIMPNVGYGKSTLPVSHFGYDTNSSLGTSYDQDQYLLLNALARLLYPKVYADFPSSWQFTPMDFEKLDEDSSTNLVYNNGGFEFYQVLGEGI